MALFAKKDKKIEEITNNIIELTSDIDVREINKDKTMKIKDYFYSFNIDDSESEIKKKFYSSGILPHFQNLNISDLIRKYGEDKTHELATVKLWFETWGNTFTDFMEKEIPADLEKKVNQNISEAKNIIHDQYMAIIKADKPLPIKHKINLFMHDAYSALIAMFTAGSVVIIRESDQDYKQKVHTQAKYELRQIVDKNKPIIAEKSLIMYATWQAAIHAYESIRKDAEKFNKKNV